MIRYDDIAALIAQMGQDVVDTRMDAGSAGSAE